MRIFQIICLIFFTGLIYAPATAQPASEENGRSLLRFWRAACYRGDTDSCFSLVRILRNAPDEETGFSEARHLSQSSCNAGIQQGCVRLGEMYLHGRGMDQDKPRATDLFETACEQDEGSGCYQLAQIAGSDGSDSQDMVAFLERACTLEDPNGCAELAFYHDSPVKRSGGEYISKEEDSVSAAAYLRLACAYARFPVHSFMNPCYQALERSEHLPAVQALSLLERGCNLGGELSCVVLAEHFGNDPDQALFWYQRGCFWGSYPACAYFLLTDAEPQEMPRDEFGVTTAQRNRAISLLPFARTECNDADQNCRILGFIYEIGAGVEQSYSEAQDLFRRSCEAERRPDGRACVSLAFLALSGKGSEPDQARAFVYIRRACDLGIQETCALLEQDENPSGPVD